MEDELSVALSTEEYRRQQAEIRRIRAFSTGDGDAVGGDKITVTVHGGASGPQWRVSRYTWEEVADRCSRLVSTPTQRALADLLGERRIAILRGGRRTGRKTMALAALALLTNDIRQVEGVRPPAELTGDVIVHRAGYVFDATDAAWAGRLRAPAVLACLDTLREREAYLVVVVATDCDAEAVGELAVRHVPADPLEILRRHLRTSLPEEPGLDATISAALSADPPPLTPADAVAQARGLIRGLADGGAIADALAGRPNPQHKEARRLLRQQRDGGHQERDPARRAFLIAWSVLDGLPAVQICRAAQRLALRLHYIESPKIDRKLSQLPFEFALDTWLDYVNETNGSVLATGDRRLHMPKGFDTAVFDVVWLDYVVAHEAMLDWLSELAGDTDRLVRAKVALALGRLAAHDFDFIAQRFFVGWSQSDHASLQEVTAWALGQVTKQRPDLRRRVFRLADAWARGASAQRRLTATRLYGANLGALDPERAMKGLRWITLKEARVLKKAGALRGLIIWSVVEIFADGAGTAVSRSLADWAISPQPAVRWMVAETLAELARLNDAADRPLLLVHYDSEPDLVAELWRRVLTSPRCGGKPWNALRAWQQRKINISGLRARLERDERLRRPLAFYLGRPPVDAAPSAATSSGESP